jgi:uncharacterized membrane protein (DUF373 family)
MNRLIKIMKRFLETFERIIALFLLLMLVIVVFLGTVELGYILFEQMQDTPHFLLLNIEEVLKIFDYFLLIIIGLELIEATKVYLEEEVIHVEIIFLVAMVAIARKVIILDITKYHPLVLFGISSIILALTIGFYFLIKTLKPK